MTINKFNFLSIFFSNIFTVVSSSISDECKKSESQPKNLWLCFICDRKHQIQGKSGQWFQDQYKYRHAKKFDLDDILKSVQYIPHCTSDESDKPRKATISRPNSPRLSKPCKSHINVDHRKSPNLLSPSVIFGEKKISKGQQRTLSARSQGDKPISNLILKKDFLINQRSQIVCFLNFFMNPSLWSSFCRRQSCSAIRIQKPKDTPEVKLKKSY